MILIQPKTNSFKKKLSFPTAWLARSKVRILVTEFQENPPLPVHQIQVIQLSQMDACESPSIWMFPQMMVPPKSPILIGFSIVFTIHFGVFPYFFKHPFRNKFSFSAPLSLPRGCVPIDTGNHHSSTARSASRPWASKLQHTQAQIAAILNA